MLQGDGNTTNSESGQGFRQVEVEVGEQDKYTAKQHYQVKRSANQTQDGNQSLYAALFKTPTALVLTPAVQHEHQPDTRENRDDVSSAGPELARQRDRLRFAIIHRMTKVSSNRRTGIGTT